MKTTPTKLSVTKFLNTLEEQQQKDAKVIIKLIKKITGNKPIIWGDNFIIGFGNYRYKRKGKKEELEWFNVGFAPRKNKFTLYLTCYLENEPLIKKLGKCTHGKGCLHIKKLEDIDLNILTQLIEKYKDTTWYS